MDRRYRINITHHGEFQAEKMHRLMPGMTPLGMVQPAQREHHYWAARFA